MKTLRELVVTVACGAALVMAAGCGPATTPGGDREPKLCELTGVMRTGGDTKTLMPYLVLDGSGERCYARGKVMAPHDPGTRLYVRGVLRSELFDDTGKDWTKPGAPQPPPFLKGWVVYLDVKEAKVITEPFDTH